MTNKTLNYHNYRVDVLLRDTAATWYVSVPTEFNIEGGISVLLEALVKLRRRARVVFQIVGVQYRQREPEDGLKLTITEDQQAWAAPDVWEQLGLGTIIILNHGDTPGAAAPQ